MAITVTAAITSVGPRAANVVLNGVVTVVNNGANTITVQSMQVDEVGSNLGATFRQPDFLTPNVAPGDGVPSILTTATAYYPFAVVCPSPNFPGSSPNAPNGSRNPAEPVGNSVLSLSFFVSTNDATAGTLVNGSTTLQVPLRASLAPFPVPLGGALQFNAASDAVNAFFFF